MYLLDANIMIEAKNRYYAFDICPGFWDWLDSSHSRGRVFSTVKIRDEILKGEDDLAEWVDRCARGFFKPAGDDTVPHLRTLAQWCNGSTHYTSAAKATFLRSADYALVAQAREYNFAVVTHETPSASKNKVKIPEAAACLGVPVVSPFDVMRAEGARLS